eukprot:comp23692_c0_seq2/m.40681 comp23692_c0_seq2/g.40681  ORF comp23692_c0_seq2/g.40681 comp23692_c0_seq2/m.40681 type:complete len:107 (-) comp23692_c0_seq2:848-1168(-)
MAVLPVDKLLGLLVRQLSKPLANQIKQQAVGHPLLRRAFIGFGQIWHRWEMNIKIRFLGHIPIAIKALPEEKAFQSGAEVFGGAAERIQSKCKEGGGKNEKAECGF